MQYLAPLTHRQIYRTANISCTEIVRRSWNRGKTEFIRVKLAVMMINSDAKTSTGDFIDIRQQLS